MYVLQSVCQAQYVYSTQNMIVNIMQIVINNIWFHLAAGFSSSHLIKELPWEWDQLPLPLCVASVGQL